MAAFGHLEFGKKLQFWSRALYWDVILHLLSECRVDWPIRHRDIAKKTIFNMVSVRHLEFEKFRFFLLNNHPGMEICIGISNLLEIK